MADDGTAGAPVDGSALAPISVWLLGHLNSPAAASERLGKSSTLLGTDSEGSTGVVFWTSDGLKMPDEMGRGAQTFSG